MQKKLITFFLLIVVTFLTPACGVVSIQSQPGYYPPFVKAAQQGNIAEAEKLLKSGDIVNQTTIGNQTPLHLAAEEGQDDMVKWLLAHDANPIAQDQNGKTPADFAKSQGHTQTSQLILDYVDLLINEENAIKAGDTETLQELLSQDGRGYTVLHIAAQIGASQLISDEIKSGADVNAQTVNGITPLIKAVINGKAEIAQLLINGGADVNIVDVYSNTPLYYAISFENKELVKLFLEAAADTNIRSVWGNETAREFAKRLGNAEIISLLEIK